MEPAGRRWILQAQTWLPVRGGPTCIPKAVVAHTRCSPRGLDPSGQLHSEPTVLRGRYFTFLHLQGPGIPTTSQASLPSFMDPTFPGSSPGLPGPPLGSGWRPDPTALTFCTPVPLADAEILCQLKQKLGPLSAWLQRPLSTWMAEYSEKDPGKQIS